MLIFYYLQFVKYNYFNVWLASLHEFTSAIISMCVWRFGFISYFIRWIVILNENIKYFEFFKNFVIFLLICTFLFENGYLTTLSNKILKLADIVEVRNVWRPSGLRWHSPYYHIDDGNDQIIQRALF